MFVVWGYVQHPVVTSFSLEQSACMCIAVFRMWLRDSGYFLSYKQYSSKSRRFWSYFHTQYVIAMTRSLTDIFLQNVLPSFSYGLLSYNISSPFRSQVPKIYGGRERDTSTWATDPTLLDQQWHDFLISTFFLCALYLNEELWSSPSAFIPPYIPRRLPFSLSITQNE